jgi:hypothetical protein
LERLFDCCEIGPILLEEGRHSGPLEGDRRAFRVMLVIDIAVGQSGHDVVEIRNE